jgi:hypothetical protein
MPIVGVRAISRSAWNSSDSGYTASWVLIIPPTPTMVKVFISSFELGAHPAAIAEITSYWRRLPNGSAESIVFPYGENRCLLYEGSLMSVTFSLTVRNCYAKLIGVLEHWG